MSKHTDPELDAILRHRHADNNDPLRGLLDHVHSALYSRKKVRVPQRSLPGLQFNSKRTIQPEQKYIPLRPPTKTYAEAGF